MSIDDIRKRLEAERVVCPRCGGDGCDPEEYMPNRSQLQMDPDPCMECLPTLLAERNQFSQDIKTLLDLIGRMGLLLAECREEEHIANGYATGALSRETMEAIEAILKELEEE